MKVGIIGSGYVGLVVASCLSESGNDVVCADIVEEKIARLNAGDIPIYEPGLEPLVDRNLRAGRLTLTTDVAGQRGTFAASAVHQQVRRDVLTDDARKEGRTLRRDLLAPIVRLRFGQDVPVPLFRRRLKRATSARDLAAALDVAVNRLGASVPAGWAHEALGIPQGDDTEAKLSGVPR